MSEKPKIDKPQQARINRYGFLALWIAAQLLGWWGFYHLSEDISQIISNILNRRFIFAYGWASMQTSYLITGQVLGIGIPSLVLQKIALQLHFAYSFRGWYRLNLLAWLLNLGF